MGGHEDHQGDAIGRYPVLGLTVASIQFAVTRDSVLVLLTLVAGYALVRAGASVPDVDTPSSRPRQEFGRLVTGALFLGVLVSLVRLVVPSVGRVPLVAAVPAHLRAITLCLLLLIWIGMSSTHRSITHTLVWAGAVAIGVGALGYTLLRHSGPRLALAFGGGLAVYSFVGVYSHLDLDDERKLLWTGRDESLDGHAQHVDGAAADYPTISAAVVCFGFVFFDASVVLLLILALGYASLVVGRMLPDIDSKKSVIRWLFDASVAALLTAELVRQSLLATPSSARLGGASVALPRAVTPTLLLLLAVLWWERDSDARSETVTHSVVWAGAVVVAAAAFVAALASVLPLVQSVVAASAVASYLAVGLGRRLRAAEGA
jgi:hypothetical protein